MTEQYADDGHGNLMLVPDHALTTTAKAAEARQPAKWTAKSGPAAMVPVPLPPTPAPAPAPAPASAAPIALPDPASTPTVKPKQKNDSERKLRTSNGPKPKMAPNKAPESQHLKLLTRILQSKRAHGSLGVAAFAAWLESVIPGGEWVSGNYVYSVPCADKSKSKVLFSSHIDTCHIPLVSDEKPQKLAFDAQLGHIFLDTDNREHGYVLGADDGAGIYIMLRMIEAKVPGVYVFHEGEERGGIGSRKLLLDHREWLGNFNIAVAFDRAQTYEVIHTQGGDACASIKCATELSKALSNEFLSYECSANGSFTDTKTYRNVISECFNIGVGYAFQHSPAEYLDVFHLEALAEQCCKVKWDELPVLRDPEAVSWPKPQGNYFYEGQSKHAYGGAHGWDAPKKPASLPPAKVYKPAKKLDPAKMSMDELRDWLYTESDDAAVYIAELQVQLLAAKTQARRMAELLGIKL